MRRLLLFVVDFVFVAGLAFDIHDVLVEHAINLTLLTEALEQIALATDLPLGRPAVKNGHVRYSYFLLIVYWPASYYFQSAPIKNLSAVWMAVMVDEIGRPV